MTLRLLVIDDDPAAILASLASSGLGADCDTTGTAADHDCVLVGGDLGRARGAHGTPVIYLTDAPNDDLEAAALDAGAVDVLPRGTTPARLATRVRHAIRFGRAELNTQQLRAEILKVLSHDLRTPLHAIGLACDALRDHVSADGTRYLDAIERSAGRIEKLIGE